jgi:hypothetical protein
MTTIPEGWKLAFRERFGDEPSAHSDEWARWDLIRQGWISASIWLTAAPAAPEGADMTPADARVLRKANLDLATESCRLQEALRWYAEGNHLLGTDGWESVSGEPENWLASPNADEPAMVEDGFTAREALAPFSVEPDAEPPAQGPST